jgi:hypothetical protein
MEKMIKCINTENGSECEMPEHVTKDAGWMLHLGLEVKPTVKTISQKEIIVKLTDAKTIQEIDVIMDGEDRKACVEFAEKRKQELK